MEAEKMIDRKDNIPGAGPHGEGRKGKSRKGGPGMKITNAAICVLIAIFVGFIVIDILEPTYGFFGKVDAGNVGILTTFGKIHDETLESGFHVKGLFSRVNQVNVRTQRKQIELVAFSSDIQQTTLLVTVNFNITPNIASRLFRSVGMEYVDTLIIPRVNEDAKVVISNYTAEALIENRETLSSKILELLQKDLSDYGITISGVSIENMDFTDAFEQAVEAKQVATQQKLTAQTEQDKLTMEQKAEAERKQIAADAEAYAIRTKAEAEAAANELVSQTLTDELIRYHEVQTWNGKLPTTYIGSDQSIPVINVGGGSAGE